MAYAICGLAHLAFATDNPVPHPAFWGMAFPVKYFGFNLFHMPMTIAAPTPIRSMNDHG